MKLIPYRIVLLILSFLVLTEGCKETDTDVLPDDEMHFSFGSSSNTKTVYDSADPWQINWLDGDQVTIYCAQAKGDANKQKATYDVTPNATASSKGTLSKAESEGGIGLRWDGNTAHNIYAVYPSVEASNGNVSSTSEGQFLFNFPAEQHCSLDGVTKNADGNYMLVPDMDLAYMVAKQEGITPTSTVNLRFKPIATTLEVTLRGKSVQDLRLGDSEDLTTIVIKSLELTLDNGGYVTKSGDNYQVQFDATKDFYNENALKSSASSSKSTFVVKISGGGDSLTLAQDESVTFTVFLPPIADLKNVTATFNVASGSANNTMTILADGVTYGSKRRIKMPNATAYPFSTFMENVLTTKYNIKKVKVNGKEIIDVTDPDTRKALESIAKFEVYYSDATLKPFIDEILTDSELGDQLKGIEYLKNLNLFIFSGTDKAPNCQLKSIDVSRLPKSVKVLNISNNNFEEIKGLEQVSDLTNLVCSSNKLSQLDLSMLMNLTLLNCDNNSLSSIDVTQNGSLTTLSINGNSLSTIDLTHNPALSSLSCFQNGMKSLDVTQNPKLTNLNCQTNNISQLDVSHNLELKFFFCSKNKLTVLDVTQNTKLTTLQCFNNSITSLDVTNNTNLETLWCTNNKLSSLNVDHNTLLKNLQCSGNTISALDVTHNPLLTILQCNHNNISVLNLTQNTKLTTLYAHYNYLTALDVTPTSITRSNNLICHSQFPTGTILTLTVTTAQKSSGVNGYATGNNLNGGIADNGTVTVTVVEQ